jgi:hypothetical protein
MVQVKTKQKEVKVKVTIEGAMKAHRGSRNLALLFF